MTIGNEMNDLPMYAVSAIGVAVANGREGLKDAADYICQKAYGQGVVEAIERFALETALQGRDE
ncbi:phosphoglycolate phosphatase [compost metagenome]